MSRSATARSDSTDPDQRSMVDELVDSRGRTFAQEAGIRLRRNTPTPLFRLLCLSLLSSARISADIAMQAAVALADDGQTSPAKLLDATWAHRTEVLNRAGYARYDESTSRYLADTAELIVEEWDGDLRNLRAEAAGDVGRMQEMLQRCKGIGEAGAQMFLREVQLVWPEVCPLVDGMASRSADALGLPTDAERLRALTDDDGDFVRFVAALVRTGIAGDHASLRDRTA